MANAYSRPLNYSDTIDITDVAKFTGQIQGQLQKKFDINIAKIEDLVGQIASAPLARGKDKQYLGERLQNMIQSVDANAKLNLTDNTVTSQIGNYISSAIDDNLKKQIGNTVKLNQFNSEVQALKIKDPKLYNDKNYAYALNKSGYEKYINEESDDLGNLNYTPFVDKNQVLDELKKIKELKGDQVVEIPDGMGGKSKTTLKGLTESEIYQYMPQLLSSDILNQIKIDGWAKYKDNMPQAQLEFDKYKDSKLASLNDEIAVAKAGIKNKSLGASTIQKYKKLLEEKTLEKQDTERFLQTVDTKDPEQVGFFLEKGAYQYSVAKIAAGRQSVEYEADDIYFQRQNLELAIEKNNREALESEFNMDLKTKEFELKQKTEGNKSNGIGANGLNVYEASPLDTNNLPENFDAGLVLTNDYNREFNNIVGNISKAYNGDEMDEDKKEQFDAILASKGIIFQNGKLARIKGSEDKSKNLSLASEAVKAFAESKMGVVYPEISQALNASETKAENLGATLAEVNKKSLIEPFKQNADKYINQLKLVEEGTRRGLSIGQDIVSSSIIEDFGLTNYKKKEEDLKKVNKEINDFVKENGGWGKIKENSLNNSQNIKRIGDLVRKAKTIEDSVIDFVGDGIYEESSRKASELLIAKNKTGGGAYLKTFNQYNVTDKDERNNIFNLITQNSTNGNSALFNDNLPITIRPKADGSIDIMQNQGMGSATQEGGPIQKVPAFVNAKPNTALFNYINGKIDMTSDRNGLDARVASKARITPYAEPVFLDKGDSATLGRADAVMGSVSREIQSVFFDEPANYLNEKRTREVFTKHLSGVMSQADLSYVINNLDSNLKYYDLIVKPIDGVWGAEVSNIDKTLNIRGKFTKSSQYLDPQILELTKNYPQVIIMDKVLQYLKENPGEARKIIRDDN